MALTKVCKTCGKPKPLDKFGPLHGGKYRRGTCYVCWGKNRRRLAPEEEREYRRRRRRANPVQLIWEDSRRSDKKKGLENDLTKEFIAEQIDKGCSYCGETELRMTLDRVDNGLGHTMDNVVPACIRCNYVRGNMPHEAWLCLRSGLRHARREGLFGDWTGRRR
jgi:hypothetical protein